MLGVDEYGLLRGCSAVILLESFQAEPAEPTASSAVSCQDEPTTEQFALRFKEVELAQQS